MRRVVVTGMGIVSSIGNNTEEVAQSLKEGNSGIEFCDEYAERGFRSQVYGSIKLDAADFVDRKALRFMGDGAAFNYIAMKDAILDSGLSKTEISNEETGLVVGSGGSSTKNQILACETATKKGAKRVGPYMVPRCMASTNSANLATQFSIKGINYSITAACATSAHCVGHAGDLIRMGRQKIVFAGGGEELDWTLSVLFDGMGAMSSKYNDRPEIASRAYDINRDGFVISGGGGVLVMEDLEHAQARGARIYAELEGYGATSDGLDMVQPSGEGAARCMRMALSAVKGNAIDYINAHGTSTPVGDEREIEAVREVFGSSMPPISSTKSLTGHSQGATGVHEAIYSLLMLRDDFIAASANIDKLDPACLDAPIAQKRVDNAGLNRVMSNSFGFGGTNATLIFNRFRD